MYVALSDFTNRQCTISPVMRNEPPPPPPSVHSVSSLCPITMQYSMVKPIIIITEQIHVFERFLSKYA